jgi:hypothetical protein
MPICQLIRPGTHILTNGRKFFFDTSVWIYMFGPLLDSKNKYTTLYSAFYKSVLQESAESYRLPCCGGVCKSVFT